ncbi:hypothetical protein [Streptomyces sp. NPDC006875]|uniref:hypothetical protein n=1 Tax=Streptomyces sp. NPDC006875 TaxID=3154781 RepID=UPI0033F31F54
MTEIPGRRVRGPRTGEAGYEVPGRGPDAIARSDGRMVGLGPYLLLRPGGPLCPTDAPREVEVAAGAGPEPGPDRLTVRIRLRGGTVVRSGLAYPGPYGIPSRRSAST